MKLIIFLTVIISQAAQAKVSVKNTKPIEIPQAETSAWTKDDVAKIIPTDLQNSDDAGYVASKIGDHAVQNWLNSPSVKNSSLGRAADQVQDSMKTETVIRGRGPSAVDHKFTFQVLAFQAISQFKYTGWLNAAIDFDARIHQTRLEISEKIWNNKDFVMSHISGAEQAISAIGLRWSW